MNRFKIQNLSLCIMLIIGFGIFSHSAFSKTIYANTSEYTAMEPAIAVSYAVHSKEVRGIISSISSNGITIFNNATRSDENYILNNKTELEDKNLSRIKLSPAKENSQVEKENLPNLLRKGYLVILEMIPGSNVVRTIKLMEIPQ